MKTFQQINAHTCTHAQTSKQTERIAQMLLTSHSRAPLVTRMSLSGAMMSSPQKLYFHWMAYVSSINPYLVMYYLVSKCLEKIFTFLSDIEF